MPARSKAQQHVAAMAKAVKAGKLSFDNIKSEHLRDAVHSMMTMGTHELSKFSSTPTRGLPQRVKRKKKRY